MGGYFEFITLRKFFPFNSFRGCFLKQTSNLHGVVWVIIFISYGNLGKWLHSDARYLSDRISSFPFMLPISQRWCILQVR